MARDTVRRTRITDTWEPSEADREFAANLGVDPDKQAPFFRDHHISHGNLMASWPAAWRTWCRKEVSFGRASGKPALPYDASDSYGAEGWARQLPDAKEERVNGDRVARYVAGWDVVGVARDLCQAAGLSAIHWRGDLSPIAEWLRAGVEPDSMLAVVRNSKGPREPGNWRWYQNAMMSQPREDVS